MSDPLFDVAQQVVLVSGGSRGIGRAIAEGFASRGARVVITGRDQATLAQTARDIESSSGNCQWQVCDVADPQQIDCLVPAVLACYDRIDTLINVAGVNRRQSAQRLTSADYDAVFDVNAKGAFLLSQRVGRHMLERGEGSQINIASLSTHRPLTNMTVYSMSKAALGQMTRALALEWGSSGVRVNALAPGFIVTDLTRQLWSTERMQQWAVTNTPLRRLGEPCDLVGTAVFLAAPASQFMTGQILYVDGGFSAGWPWPIDT